MDDKTKGILIGAGIMGAAAMFSKKLGLADIAALLPTEREIARNRTVSVTSCDWNRTKQDYDCDDEEWRGSLLEFLEDNEDGLSGEEISEYLNLKPGGEIYVGGGAAQRFRVKRLK